MKFLDNTDTDLNTALTSNKFEELQ